MIIETDRLIIRPFAMDDLAAIHRILNLTFGNGSDIDDPSALADRRSWLEWSMLNQEWFPKLHQPPYGDRAIILKGSARLIGAVGYVPMLDAYEQIPELRSDFRSNGYNTTEFGLFWAIEPTQQRRGYATEAARAMIEHAFRHLRLKRILATTEHSNLASQRVMQKVGMKLARNPFPEPRWLQVVGILENPGA